jgi:glycosyltransferase involved in cell wall biosynthesis
MKILVNCSTLKKGGVLQVGHSFISELIHRNDHHYFFIIPSGLKKEFDGYLVNGKHKFFTYDVKPSVFLSLTGKERYLNRILEETNPDIVFSLFGPTYWKPKRLHVCGYAKAGYFYPDSPFIQSMPMLRKLKLFVLKQFHLNDFFRFNNALITETRDATTRLSGLLPSKKVYTVSNTYNQIFDHPDKWDTNIQLPAFDGVTLLSITANYRHKNLGIIPQVISYLKNTYPTFKFRFVLTLNEGEINISESMRDHVLFLGRVSIYQCPPLYEKSDIMFMPTLLECFSATYPEAMKMEVPILTSDMPFAKDVCGNAALYFNPLSPKSIAESIYYMGTNKDVASELIEKGRLRLKEFDDSKSRAQKYIEILEEIYETNNSKS